MKLSLRYQYYIDLLGDLYAHIKKNKMRSDTGLYSSFTL